MPKGYKTGGRAPGTPNRRTAERKRRMMEVRANLPDGNTMCADSGANPSPNFWNGDAVALAQAIYRDPSQPWQVRFDCMRLAARYERPQLAAVAIATEVDIGAGLSGLLASAREQALDRQHRPEPEPEPASYQRRPEPPMLTLSAIDLQRLRDLDSDSAPADKPAYMPE